MAARPASVPLFVQEQRYSDAITLFDAQYAVFLEAPRLPRGPFFYDNIQYAVKNLFSAFKTLDMQTNALIAKCTNSGAPHEAQCARDHWAKILVQMKQAKLVLDTLGSSAWRDQKGEKLN